MVSSVYICIYLCLSTTKVCTVRRCWNAGDIFPDLAEVLLI